MRRSGVGITDLAQLDATVRDMPTFETPRDHQYREQLQKYREMTILCCNLDIPLQMTDVAIYPYIMLPKMLIDIPKSSVRLDSSKLQQLIAHFR